MNHRPAPTRPPQMPDNQMEKAGKQPESWKNRLLLALFAVACALVGVIVSHISKPSSQSAAQPSSAFYNMTVMRLDGGPVALSAYRGKPVLVNFWATWCPPCVKEMPALNSQRQALAAKGVEIVGIAIDSAPKVIQFAADQHIDYPLFVGDDQATRAMAELGNQVGGLPFTLLIDGKGVIRKTYLGPIPFDALDQDIALVQR